MRHNEVRDITTTLLTEVCHGVTTGPHLQLLSGESMSHRSAITEDGARLDIAMYGFWGGGWGKIQEGIPRHKGIQPKRPIELSWFPPVHISQT